MIGTVRKPMEEILGALSDYDRVAVVGCNGCAKACQTGGEKQVEEMAGRLQDAGKDVPLAVTPERTCYVQFTTPVLEEHLDALRDVEALLVLGCGGAVQITRQAAENLDLIKPIKVGLDSVGHMDTVAAGELALEQCQECGECILNDTGGICPVTKCAKSLLNGPCGGAENGKCEVDPKRDCAWVMIYNRMAALGELDRLHRFMAAKDYSKMAKPRVLHISEGRVS
jgi:ferredoxin